MIVRLRTMDYLNLAHTTHGERTPDGGMRVFIVDAQPCVLPPDDADRLRRHLVRLDPEPLLSDVPDVTIDALPRSTLTRDQVSDGPTPKRSRRRQS